MRMNLSELEVRVLGCLMEKELTTPESYPLSLNSLVSACNQKSNREPVMTLSEGEVQSGLQALGNRGLARLTTIGGRVGRYCHSVADKLGLAPEERAILAELMLRGPQTAGELRSRAERMVEIGDYAGVEASLNKLLQAGPPLVIRLPRQAGRKDSRYAHLLSGAPEITEEAADLEESVQPRQTSTVSAGARLGQVESELDSLKEEIAQLRQEVKELVSSLS